MKNNEIDGNNIQDFKSILNNPDKKIFILIHANWCGHCKEILPVWKIIQEEKNNSDNSDNGDNSDIVIVSLESDYLDNFKDNLPTIDGFPSIYYIHKNIPEKYEGERDKENLLKFINTKSNNDINKNIYGGKNKKNNKSKNLRRKLFKNSKSSIKIKSKKSKSYKKSKSSKKSKNGKK